MEAESDRVSSAVGLHQVGVRTLSELTAVVSAIA